MLAEVQETVNFAIALGSLTFILLFACYIYHEWFLSRRENDSPRISNKRRAMTWLLCAQRIKLPKDIARLIGVHYILPDYYVYHPHCHCRLERKGRVWIHGCLLSRMNCPNTDEFLHFNLDHALVSSKWNISPAPYHIHTICCEDMAIEKKWKDVKGVMTGYLRCCACYKSFTLL